MTEGIKHVQHEEHDQYEQIEQYEQNVKNAQKKRKKKRRKKNYILRFMILIAVGFGVHYWLTSTFFDIRQITVENNRHHTRQQIVGMADVHIGQNIFTVRTSRMRDNILESPHVRSVRIRRSLPAGIVITVDERLEAAKVPYADTFIIIDKDGLVLRRTGAQLQLPILLGMTIKSMEEGRPLEVEKTSVLTGTLQMLETMESTNLFFRAIDISNVIIRAHIFENLICEGTPENVKRSMKNGGLEKLLYELYTNGVERGIIYVGSDNHFSFNPMI